MQQNNTCAVTINRLLHTRHNAHIHKYPQQFDHRYATLLEALNRNAGDAYDESFCSMITKENGSGVGQI